MAGGFMGSTVVHIPALKRAYIYGGRNRHAEPESSKNFDNSNIAILDLSQSFPLAKHAQAVADAGFVLPAVSYYSPAVATVSGAGDTATYSVTLFGNRHGNLANVSTTGPYSIDWMGMVTAWDDNTLVLTGGYSLRDARLSWIYTYDLIASKWARYSFNMTGGRNDHASVVYKAFSKQFLVTVGGTDVPTTSVVEYLDLAARSPPVRATVQNPTAGPAQIGGHAMFLQGNYLVCVGGWDMGGASYLLNLLEIFPQDDGTLQFAWADAYKAPTESTPTTTSTATKTPMPKDSDETATGFGGSGLSSGAIAGIAAAAIVAVAALGVAAFAISRVRARQAKLEKDLEDAANTRLIPVVATSRGSALASSRSDTDLIKDFLAPGPRRAADGTLLLPGNRADTPDLAAPLSPVRVASTHSDKSVEPVPTMLRRADGTLYLPGMQSDPDMAVPLVPDSSMRRRADGTLYLPGSRGDADAAPLIPLDSSSLRRRADGTLYLPGGCGQLNVDTLDFPAASLTLEESPRGA